MITEDYVSFETAKLLKEKGFDWECFQYWHEDDNKLIHSQSMHPIQNVSNPCFFGPAAPTLQMAMKWLIEVHKLYVNVCPCVEGYYWTEKWHSYTGNLEARYPVGRFIGTFNSHEQACEAAIKYCLENLI